MSAGNREELPPFANLRSWADARDIPLATARIRFAQWAILTSIADAHTLRNNLVLKGGNALDFVWRPNRSTVDIDFSVTPGLLDHASLRLALDAALEAGQRRLGLSARIQRWHSEPKSLERATFSAIQATVGYALPDQRPIANRMALGIASAQVIPLDIAFSDPICEVESRKLAPGLAITTATPNDIAAEKLRALLQQPIRNRSRPQDVLDLAILIQSGILEPDRVGRFLVIKANARSVPVSKNAFAEPAIRERASRDYQILADQTRNLFIPFDEAFRTVLDFVETMPIP